MTEDAKVVLDVLREMASAEVTRADRLIAHGRQTFVLSAGFFAVAQPAAFTGFASDAVSHVEGRWLVACAIAAAASLLTCAVTLMRVDKPREVPEVSPRDIARETATQEKPIAAALGDLYATQVDEWRSANETRRKRLGAVQVTAMLTGGLALAELIVALAARIQ